MRSFLAIIFSFIFSLAVSAGVPKQVLRLEEKSSVVMDHYQTTEAWSRVGVPRLIPGTNKIAADYAPMLGAPQGIIESVATWNNTTVTFRSLSVLQTGSFLVFRMILPNGMIIPMRGFAISGEGYWSAQIWDGRFPGVWPSGWTMFEALIISPSGEVSSSVAQIPVNIVLRTAGPLEQATPSQDGKTIKLRGSFYENTVVTIDGTVFSMKFLGFDYKTGVGMGEISLEGFYLDGQKMLTINCMGMCSTQMVYIPTRNGQ